MTVETGHASSNGAPSDADAPGNGRHPPNGREATTNAAHAAPPRREGTADAAHAAPPRLEASADAAHAAQPRLEASADAAHASPPGREPTTNLAHASPPRREPTTNVAHAAQPRREPTHLVREDPLAALLDEGQAAVSDSANALRDVRERYRAAYLEQVDRWQSLRAAVAASPGTRPGTDEAHETKESLARDETVASREVGAERSTLDRIDLAVKSLENAWLFLAREDTSLVSDPSGPASAADAQMRIVEAQEAERARLAREVHDGPAQALANAIFQVEVVQRLLDRDERLARAELKQLREVLTRELRGVRAYLSQLRPPLLADLGLSGAIHEAADQIGSALNIPVTVELDDGIDQLPETVEVVTLRVIQEALQNARKHAQASSIRIRVEREDAGWAVEVRDDGRGFDADAMPVASGRRNFGLQFMRERAELIGARFEVRSSANLGTAVRMLIPAGALGMAIPGEEMS